MESARALRSKRRQTNSEDNESLTATNTGTLSKKPKCSSNKQKANKMNKCSIDTQEFSMLPSNRELSPLQNKIHKNKASPGSKEPSIGNHSQPTPESEVSLNEHKSATECDAKSSGLETSEFAQTIESPSSRTSNEIGSDEIKATDTKDKHSSGPRTAIEGLEAPMKISGYSSEEAYSQGLEEIQVFAYGNLINTIAKKDESSSVQIEYISNAESDPLTNQQIEPRRPSSTISKPSKDIKIQINNEKDTKHLELEKELHTTESKIEIDLQDSAQSATEVFIKKEEVSGQYNELNSIKVELKSSNDNHNIISQPSKEFEVHITDNKDIISVKQETNPYTSETKKEAHLTESVKSSPGIILNEITRKQDESVVTKALPNVQSTTQNSPKHQETNMVVEDSLGICQSLHESEEDHVEDVLSEIEESLNLLTRSPARISSKRNCSSSVKNESEALQSNASMEEIVFAIDLENTKEETFSDNIEETIIVNEQNKSTSKENPTPPWERKNTSSTEHFLTPATTNSSSVTIFEEKVSVTYKVSNVSRNNDSSEATKHLPWETKQIENHTELQSDVLEPSSHEVKNKSVDSADEHSMELSEEENVLVLEPKSDEVPFVKPSEKRSNKHEQASKAKRFKTNESEDATTVEINDVHTSAVKPRSKIVSRPDDPWTCRLPPPPGEDNVILPPLCDMAEDMELQDDDEDSAPTIESQSSKVELLSDIVEVSPGQFETDYLLNDLPNHTRSHILLAGVAWNVISKKSGAAVYSRGKFLDPQRSQSGHETPLHLHIEGTTRLYVESAVNEIEKLKRQVEKDNESLVEKLVVGLNSAPSLELVRLKIAGPGGENLDFIREETNAKVSLHGWGSGTHEPGTNQEAPEPMHIRIEHNDPEKWAEARKLAEHLIMSVQGEAMSTPHPHQPPIMVFPTPQVIPIVPQILPIAPMVYEGLPVLHPIPRPTIPPKNIPAVAVATNKIIPQPKRPSPSKPVQPISKSVPTISPANKTTLVIPPPLKNPPSLSNHPLFSSNTQLLKPPFKPDALLKYTSRSNSPLENKMRNEPMKSNCIGKSDVPVITSQPFKKPIKKIQFSIITANKTGGVEYSTTFTTDAKKSNNCPSKFTSSIEPSSSVETSTPSKTSGQLSEATGRTSYSHSKFVQVMNLLLKALQLQISTMSVGPQRNQMQQIFQLLGKALPQQTDSVITPQQRVQLRTIITLLEKGLQTITSGDPPEQLLRIMQLMQKFLVTPETSVGHDSSIKPPMDQNVPRFIPQTSQGLIRQSTVTTISNVRQQFLPAVSTQSQVSPPNIALQPQVQQRQLFTQQPVVEKVQSAAQHTETTFTVQRTFTSSAGGVQTLPPQPVPFPTVSPQNLSENIQHQAIVPRPNLGLQSVQRNNETVPYAESTPEPKQKPNDQLDLMRQLLQTSLHAHSNNMTEGPSKELVVKICNMLEKNFEDRDNTDKLVETLHLLEQALKLPNFATSSGEQPLQLAQILQLVQQALKAESRPKQTQAQPVEKTIPSNECCTKPLQQQLQNTFVNVTSMQQAQIQPVFQQTQSIVQPVNQLVMQFAQTLQPLQSQPTLGVQPAQPGNLMLVNFPQGLQQQQQPMPLFPQQSLMQAGNPMLAQIAQGLQHQPQVFNPMMRNTPNINQQPQLLQIAQQQQTNVPVLSNSSTVNQSARIGQPVANILTQQSNVPQLKPEIPKPINLLQRSTQINLLQRSPQTSPTGPVSTLIANETAQSRTPKVSEQALAAVQKDASASIMERVSKVSNSTDCTELSITTVPEVDDSLCSSLAYIFFGPFETVTVLTRAGSNLRQQVIKYIREHKHVFFKYLSSLYNNVFPNHEFDPQMAFEHCCVYLADPGHTAIYEILFAVATIFGTPIVVLYEDGKPSQKVNPFQPSSVPAIKILSRKNNTFAPVDEVISQGSSETIQRVFPFSSHSSKPSLMVATWHVQKASNSFGQKELSLVVDECLALRRIDLACVQGVGLNCGKLGRINTTPHYKWYGTGANNLQESVVILIRKNSGVDLKHVQKVNLSTLSANIVFYNVAYCVIGTLLPSTSNEFHSDYVYSLQKAIALVPVSSQILILGNLNAHIGVLDIRKPHKEYIGENLFHEKCNHNGSLLLSWIKYYKLQIVSSLAYETPDSKVTWKVGSESFQVSHILIRHQPFMKLRNFLWWETCSDHAIVSCNVEIGSSSSTVSTDTPHFTVATWNVVDSVTDALRNEIDMALFNNKIDLACLQGAHSAHFQVSTDHYHWWCTGIKKSVNAYGICFLLRKNSRAKLKNVKGISNRIARATLSFDGCDISILGCELPESKSNTAQQVYCEILHAASEEPPTAKLLILGKFNAIFGRELLYYRNISLPLISSSGIRKGDISNKNGQRLMNLAILYDLYICSTFINEPLPQDSHILYQNEEPVHICRNYVSKFPILAINITAKP